ncbi:EAL domain-containing protein [Teichococcus aestuarii]|uniref:EAL domain-containing protein n=1 Tax=Teichococcus aestuarii TaxID=568898 RepID=UPI0036101127
MPHPSVLRQPAVPFRTLVLADDPAILTAARMASNAAGDMAPLFVASGREALRQLFRADDRPARLICQPSTAGESWPALMATARDPFAPTGLVLVREQQRPPAETAGLVSVPPEVKALTRALRTLSAWPPQIPTDDPHELALGLARGEIAVRYQPVLNLADRRPVLLEGLARWQRRDDTPLSPDLFVPLAERHGLSRALAQAVALVAFTEMAPRAARLGSQISLNLPLELMLEPETLGWLRRLLASTRFPPGALVLELTETTPVRDRAALRRALRHFGAAGHAVLIDDMGLDDDRAALLELPFAGIKLDRHLVSAMPRSRRARALVQRLVARAHARRMSVTAEGVSSAALWRAAAMAGVDRVQGYAISRPLPGPALPAWAAAHSLPPRLAPGGAGARQRRPA